MFFWKREAATLCKESLLPLEMQLHCSAEYQQDDLKKKQVLYAQTHKWKLEWMFSEVTQLNSCGKMEEIHNNLPFILQLGLKKQATNEKSHIFFNSKKSMIAYHII